VICPAPVQRGRSQGHANQQSDGSTIKEVEGDDPFEAQERANDSFRALGRYVSEFSRLIWWMRMLIASAVTLEGRPGSYSLAEMALGESTAQPITNAFFGICNTFLESDEQKIGTRLRIRVSEAISLRNDFAHGDWFIGWRRLHPDGTIPENSEDPFLTRIRPTRKAGPIDDRDYPPADLDALSDELVVLRNLVVEFGMLATSATNDPVLKALRVRDLFTISDGEVARDGPQASNVDPVHRR
jgi:hypothetical protein